MSQSCTKIPKKPLESLDSVAGALLLVMTIEVNGEYRHAFEDSSGFQRPGIKRSKSRNQSRSRHDFRSGILGVAAHEDVALERNIGFCQDVRRDGLEGRNDLDTFGYKTGDQFRIGSFRQFKILDPVRL